MLGNEQAETVHGKAATLQQLQDAGFRVPEFAVLNSACSGPALETELDVIIARLGFPLAVRSSGSVEDGPGASFAGQFESYLNLWSPEELRRAVQRCRESVHRPAVVEYCRGAGIVVDDVRMQVVIQKMVEPELAGVVFTVNPVTGLEAMTIEACAGLGEELLAGRDSALPDNHPLLQQHRAKIEAVASRVARHFGCPQDVEFAVADGIVWVLQSRPITRIGTSGINGEWTNANFREGGVSSTVCSPLMWSLYNMIWDSSLKKCLQEIKLLSVDFEPGHMFFGRPYWNLGALKQCLTKIPGFVEREFDTDLGIQIGYEGDGIRTPATPWNLVRVLPTVFAIRGFLKSQLAITTSLLNGGYERIHRQYESIPPDIDTAFRLLIEQDYFHFETSYFRTIFALSLAKLDFKHFFPDAGYSALMSSLPQVRHTAPLRRMRQMVQQGNSDVGTLLNDYRHHYHVGLDICHPRWDEDPEYVETLFRDLSAQPGAERQARNSGERYEEVRAETLASLPVWKRPLFRSKIDRLRHLVWLREEMRDHSNRMYHLIRRYVLEIARRRKLGDDIFFMTHHEIFQDDRRAAEGRRATYELYRNFSPPNEIGRPPSPKRNRTPGDSGFGRVLHGLSASPGTVHGTARVVRTAKAAAELPPGAILVSPHTDPGWTPALSRAAGVITEAGGMLSHAAVICREFALPAVLSVHEACARIPDGSRIILQGDEGVIELVR